MVLNYEAHDKACLVSKKIIYKMKMLISFAPHNFIIHVLGLDGLFMKMIQKKSKYLDNSISPKGVDVHCLPGSFQLLEGSDEKES